MHRIQKVIVLVGIPASGKSTLCKTVYADYKRINKDSLRAMIDNYVFNNENENLILKTRNLMIKEFLASGFNVIIDDTNISQKHINVIRDIVVNFVNRYNRAVQFEVNVLDTPLDVCIARNNLRTEHEHVPKDVIYNMYDKLMKNKNLGNHAELIRKQFYEQNKTLPKAIICDIDGTVSVPTNRSPYEWSKVLDDEPLLDMIKLVELFFDSGFGHQIIFVSGRDGSCANLTRQWLEKNFNITFKLYTRQAGDMRKDCIVKKEIYHQFIENEYTIEYVLDDRSQVVDMWRNELNLRCLQVNYGDF